MRSFSDGQDGLRVRTLSEYSRPVNVICDYRLFYTVLLGTATLGQDLGTLYLFIRRGSQNSVLALRTSIILIDSQTSASSSGVMAIAWGVKQKKSEPYGRLIERASLSWSRVDPLKHSMPLLRQHIQKTNWYLFSRLMEPTRGSSPRYCEISPRKSNKAYKHMINAIILKVLWNPIVVFPIGSNQKIPTDSGVFRTNRYFPRTREEFFRQCLQMTVRTTPFINREIRYLAQKRERFISVIKIDFIALRSYPMTLSDWAIIDIGSGMNGFWN